MIKQEPNIPTQKLEYTTLMHSNLTPPSSASSTSSTSSNASSKKYSNSYLTHTSQPTTKRKLNDQKSNNIYNQKPIYSEYLSSKCLLYIYYKGDLANVIDDHFKKSFSPQKSSSVSSNRTNKTAKHRKLTTDWPSKNTAMQETNSWTNYHQHHQQHYIPYQQPQPQQPQQNTSVGSYDNSWGRVYNQHYDYSKMYPTSYDYNNYIKEEISDPSSSSSSSSILSAVAEPNQNFCQNSSSLSSSSSSSLSSSTNLTQNKLDMNNFVLAAAAAANSNTSSSYRYPQYLNNVNPINPYAHLQYNGFDLNNLAVESDTPPTITAPTYATSVWY